jgi:hypothetical protein
MDTRAARIDVLEPPLSLVGGVCGTLTGSTAVCR